MTERTARTIDTSAERAAFAARRTERTDPLQSEIAALRSGVSTLLDSLAALRADVVGLRDATEKQTAAIQVRLAVETGKDL